MKQEQNARQEMPRRWVVMGVSGSGKSEVGRRLAARLGVTYIEGDDDHSPSSIAKMAAGVPLDDSDRRDWLLRLQARIREAAQAERGMVLTCSALKRRYRDLLREGDSGIVFVHLHGDRDLIASRMRSRTGHFMPVGLLDNQLATLEPLGGDERGIQLDIRHTPDELVEQVVWHFSSLHR